PVPRVARPTESVAQISPCVVLREPQTRTQTCPDPRTRARNVGDCPAATVSPAFGDTGVTPLAASAGAANSAHATTTSTSRPIGATLPAFGSCLRQSRPAVPGARPAQGRARGRRLGGAHAAAARGPADARPAGRRAPAHGHRKGRRRVLRRGAVGQGGLERR